MHIQVDTVHLHHKKAELTVHWELSSWGEHRKQRSKKAPQFCYLFTHNRRHLNEPCLKNKTKQKISQQEATPIGNKNKKVYVSYSFRTLGNWVESRKCSSKTTTQNTIPLKNLNNFFMEENLCGSELSKGQEHVTVI